jgi:hypothetical protein
MTLQVYNLKRLAPPPKQKMRKRNPNDISKELF